MTIMLQEMIIMKMMRMRPGNIFQQFWKWFKNFEINFWEYENKQNYYYYLKIGRKFG